MAHQQTPFPSREYFSRGDEFTRSQVDLDPQYLDPEETEATQQIPGDVLELLFRFLQDTEIVPSSPTSAPTSAAHVSLRIAQMFRQWHQTGRNVHQWVPVRAQSDPRVTKHLLLLSRRALVRFRIDLGENDILAIPQTMHLVRQHFDHISRMDVLLPSEPLRRVLSYLHNIHSPMLQTLIIRLIYPDRSKVFAIDWAAPNYLLHWDRRMFSSLSHLRLEVYAPQLEDAVWRDLSTLELACMPPSWCLFTYLKVMALSPCLETLKIIGNMGPGILPLPFLEANRLKVLHISNCSSEDIRQFTLHVKLPSLEDLSLVPSKSSDLETFHRMLGNHGDSPSSIEAFDKVQWVEVGFEDTKAVLSCQLFEDKGAFTVSLPVVHRGAFVDVMSLFPFVEGLTINLSEPLDFRFGLSQTVERVEVQGRPDMVMASSIKGPICRCFPQCKSVDLLPSLPPLHSLRVPRTPQTPQTPPVENREAGPSRWYNLSRWRGTW